MLLLCRELGMGNHFKAIEYGGEAVRAMDMEARTVLANMAAELGGETGLVEPDATTLAHNPRPWRQGRGGRYRPLAFR